jgi:pSer/pThr/pTyr-binding forkhead associated (FHA) protein
MTVTWEFKGRTGTVSFKKEDVLIGRTSKTEEIDLKLDFDPRVSRKHARIWLEDDDYWLEDFGSSKGTIVNGKRLTEVWGLSETDEIQVGDTMLHVAGFKRFRTMVLKPPVEPDDE